MNTNHEMQLYNAIGHSALRIATKSQLRYNSVINPWQEAQNPTKCDVSYFAFSSVEMKNCTKYILERKKHVDVICETIMGIQWRKQCLKLTKLQVMAKQKLV